MTGQPFGVPEHAPADAERLHGGRPPPSGRAPAAAARRGRSARPRWRAARWRRPPPACPAARRGSARLIATLSIRSAARPRGCASRDADRGRRHAGTSSARPARPAGAVLAGPATSIASSADGEDRRAVRGDQDQARPAAAGSRRRVRSTRASVAASRPGGRLVEQQHGPLAAAGEQGAGQRHPAPLARRQAAAALAHGPAQRHVVQGRGVRGGRDGLVGRVRPAEPDVGFATVPLNKAGSCGTQATRERQWSGSITGEVGPASCGPATMTAARRRAATKPSRTSSSVDLPHPLGPATTLISPRRTSRRDAVGGGPGGRPGCAHRDVLDADGARLPGPSSGRRPAGAGCLEDGERLHRAAARPSALAWNWAPTARSGR